MTNVSIFILKDMLGFIVCKENGVSSSKLRRLGVRKCPFDNEILRTGTKTIYLRNAWL